MRLAPTIKTDCTLHGQICIFFLLQGGKKKKEREEKAADIIIFTGIYLFWQEWIAWCKRNKHLHTPVKCNWEGTCLENHRYFFTAVVANSNPQFRYYSNFPEEHSAWPSVRHVVLQSEIVPSRRIRRSPFNGQHVRDLIWHTKDPCSALWSELIQGGRPVAHTLAKCPLLWVTF